MLLSVLYSDFHLTTLDQTGSGLSFGAEPPFMIVSIHLLF